MWTFSLFAALLFSKVCRSYHDITVDDALSPPITYIGRWEPLSEETNDLDTGGAHHVSQDQGAMANFSFTGVAFYYWAPLWPYPVTTLVNVDGYSKVVDLQDYSSPQQQCCVAESRSSQIRTSFTGLSNGVHSMVCSMAPGGQFVVVDAFMYTVADPGDDPQINASVTATVTSVGISSSSASGPAASTTSGLSSPSKPANTTLYIVIGAGIGGAGLIGAVILIYRRRQRRRQSAVPEESPPFMASSFRSPTPVTGGIFTKATSIDASNGHFSDV